MNEKYLYSLYLRTTQFSQIAILKNILQGWTDQTGFRNIPQGIHCIGLHFYDKIIGGATYTEEILTHSLMNADIDGLSRADLTELIITYLLTGQTECLEDLKIGLKD